MVRKRVATGNMAEDVKQPLFIEAERRAWEWLCARQREGRHASVTDLRSQKTWRDFLIDGVYSLDVKTDQYFLQTGNVAWEEAMYTTGQNPRFIAGWGTHEGLDYILYVCPRDDDEAWPALLVDAQRMRKAIQEEVACNGEYTGNLKRFLHRGTDRDSVGYAVPLEFLKRHKALLTEVTV